MSVTLKGKSGADQIGRIMQSLRSDAPSTIAESAVASIGDLKTGDIVDRRTGKRIGGYELPESDVIVISLVDGTKVIARPSGTEPKIKFYILVREQDDDIDAAGRAAQAKIARVESDINAMVERILK